MPLTLEGMHFNMSSSFNSSERMKCFTLYKADYEPNGKTAYVLLALASDDTETWFALGTETIRFIAEGIEAGGRHFISAMSAAKADVRGAAFSADVAQLEKRRRSSQGAPLEFVTDWRLDLVPDFFVLEFLVATGWRRYAIDVVCVGNLMVRIQEALDGPGTGDGITVH